MTLSISGKRLLAVVGLMALELPVAIAKDLPPFGPDLGEQADVVRSFHMKTTGSVAREVTGKKGDGRTGLIGRCNPAMWANFGIHQGTPMDANQAGIAVITKGKIATGATGTFPLDQVYVDFFLIDGANISSYRFGGRGVLTITTHDASPGSRRMIGTIQASKLEGLDHEAKGKSIGVQASFDMEFSCGVK
jgi:hypothetical protein